jgi:uncharacterized protein (DUF983 family)
MAGFVTMLDRIGSGSAVPGRQRHGEERPGILSNAPSGIPQALWRGFLTRCAACGSAGMFRSFLQPVQACPGCGFDWRRRTADDFPPYLVILLIGHIIAPAIIWMETSWHPALWVHLSIWLPIVVLLALALIQPVKGAVMAFQWWHWDYSEPANDGASATLEDPATVRESGSGRALPAIAHSNSDAVNVCSGLL